MADLNRLKKVNSNKGSLGTPPPPKEASTNLEAPETAPAAEPPVARESAYAAVHPRQQQPPALAPRIDGRALRRSGRMVPLATRVTAEFDAELRQLAQDRGLLIVEVLEEALTAYKKAIS